MHHYMAVLDVDYMHHYQLVDHYMHHYMAVFYVYYMHHYMAVFYVHYMHHYQLVVHYMHHYMAVFDVHYMHHFQYRLAVDYMHHYHLVVHYMHHYPPHNRCHSKLLLPVHSYSCITLHLTSHMLGMILILHFVIALHLLRMLTFRHLQKLSPTELTGMVGCLVGWY